MAEETPAFEGWAVLELMGHRRLGGYVREQEIAGGAFLRIDVPGPEDGQIAATQFYAPGAVYCITPTTEAMARAVALRNQPEPVTRWELPAPKEELPVRACAGCGRAFRPVVKGQTHCADCQDRIEKEDAEAEHSVAEIPYAEIPF